MERLIENVFYVFVILFIGVGAYGEFHYLLPWHVEPLLTYDITGTHVIVNWYDTERELQDALSDDTLAGLSECEHRPLFNTSFCELWLVRPEDYSDEYNYDTIGHEFYHAVKGDFHE